MGSSLGSSLGSVLSSSLEVFLKSKGSLDLRLRAP
jgi:hypothetical protein